MAQVNFINAKRVKNLIGFVLIAVLNLLIVGCEQDPYDREMQTNSSTEKIAKPKNVPGLDFIFDYDVNNHDWWLETPWTIKENETGFKDGEKMMASVSHRDDRYAVADSYRNVSLEYTQNHTTKSQDFTSLVSSSAVRKVYQDSTRWTAAIEDGNLCFLDVVAKRIEASVRDTMRVLPYIKVNNAKVIKIESLPGTTQYTRGTYVSDSIVRRVTWQLDCEVIAGDVLEQNIKFSQNLQDMFKVLLLSEDDIERAYSRERDRKVIDDKTEICSFVEVFIMKSKETHEQKKSIILNRELKGIEEYLKNVTSFSYTWRKDNAISIGAVKNGVRTEGDWTVDGRTDSFGALISNDAEPLTTSYTFYHEGATYKDKWLEEIFEIVTPTMAEKATRVESIISDNENYDQARLFNDINTTYLGYAQTAGETVKLQKPAVTIAEEGWEKLDGTRVVYNDSIAWMPVYYIKYTDGNVVRTPFRCSDDRSLDPLTKWVSIEDNNNQTTGDVTIGSPSKREMTRTVNGAVFTWTRETRTLNNYAKLNKSTQENQWRSIEPVGMTVTYKGRSIAYNNLSISTTNRASVSGGSVTDGYHVYDYSDALNYRFGDNTKVATAPGIIKVLAEDIESEGWDASSAKEVWSNDRVDWTLDWVVKYNTGREDRVSFKHNAPRSFKVNTNWTSIEKNTTYGTSNETVTVTSSENQSKTVNGAVFAWVKETRDIKTVATLDASTQNNGWTAEDPMACKVTYKGKTYDFGRKNVSTSHKDHLTGGSVSGNYKVYTYGDDMSYSIGGNTKMLTAPGTIKVLNEEIESENWDNSSAKEIWSNDRVDWSLDWVTKYTTGREDRVSFAWHAPRAYNVITNWSSVESNNNYRTGNETVSVTSSEAQSQNVNGAVFSWTKETRSIKNVVTLNASTQNNGWTAEDPMACKVTYKGKTYDFGRKSPSTSHKDHLSGGSVSGDYTIYTYGDDMSYSIGGNTKMLTAPGTIKVKVAEPEPTVTSEGFENASQIVTDSLVKWKIDYVKKWSNGKEDRNSFACNAMRSLHPTTNWTSEEANSNQSTGSASASVTGSAAQSKNVNGATFSWTKETRSIKSVAKLAGSNQNNGWEAVDPVGCSVTYNGKTYNFDRLSISMSNNATVTGGNENGGYKVYNYRDKLAYTYGSNTKYSQAPGTIKVKVTTVEPPFFPAEWGELVDAKQTNANTESHKGSVYTWSLRFKNGYVLPVVVRPGATRPEWEFSYVEKTSVTTYNGGTYEAASGKWINTTAKDQPDHMIWARSGVERANKNYNIAKNENWDEGRLINGKPSTKTSRYTLTITNGKLSATDTYTGTYMGTWTSYTGN